jgi:hypothetical protein
LGGSIEKVVTRGEPQEMEFDANEAGIPDQMLAPPPGETTRRAWVFSEARVWEPYAREPPALLVVPDEPHSATVLVVLLAKAILVVRRKLLPLLVALIDVVPLLGRQLHVALVILQGAISLPRGQIVPALGQLRTIHHG